MGNMVGVDEAGRGAWAGPLVAAAVVLNKPLPGLKDSKLLTIKQREKLATQIKACALAIGIGWVWPKDIEQIGLTSAVALAMHRAVHQIVDYETIVVDGNYNYLSDIDGAYPLVKADQKIQAVSAASIIAKVARDAYMRFIADAYPHYGFEHHVGYGTKLHVAKLRKHGPCALHRNSFHPVKMSAAEHQ